MARKLLRRFLPRSEEIRAHPRLRFLARWLQHPSLWRINRRGVALGLAIGLFWAFMPMPLQMVPATILSLLLRANVPAAIAGAWVTNPFTMAPAIIVCYQVGARLLGLPVYELNFEMSWDWVERELLRVWRPYLLGSVVVGVVAAAIGYIGIQLLWRWQVVRSWEKRKTMKNTKLKMKN